jgi:hypothetical protein
VRAVELQLGTNMQCLGVCHRDHDLAMEVVGSTVVPVAFV